MACIAKRRGRWVVDFRDQRGIRRAESYPTRDAAKLALEKVLGQVRRGAYRAPSELPTVEELCAAWLASKSDRRPSTRATWEAHLRHIVARLGPVRVDRVTVQAIEAELREPLRATLAPSTLNAILATLTAVLEYGERCGYLERNAGRLVERVRADAESDAEEAEDAVLSPDEVRRLILAAAPGLARTALTVLAVTGMRSSELLALRWGDVDLDAGLIHVRRAASWSRTADEDESGARYFAPKTQGSRRDVEAPAELVSALRRWRLGCPPGELVFPKADGTPMHRRTFAGQHLEPAQERAGLRRFGAHALRHFFASELIRQGYPATEVAARLGHSSPAVTMQVYAHLYRGHKSDAVVELAKAIL